MGGELKILWLSNSPWSSGGYGVETDRVVTRMKAAGYDVEVLSNYGIQDRQTEWKGVRVWPGDPFDQSQGAVIESYCDQLRPDIVLTLWDVQAFPPDFGTKRGVRWAPWLPIDRHPLPRKIEQARDEQT